MRLQAKCALLMGATEGIGQRCAEQFAAQGARVVLTGRRAERGTRVADAIFRNGGDAKYLPCDVTDQASVQEVVAQAIGHLGRIDVLLNNARRVYQC